MGSILLMNVQRPTTRSRKGPSTYHALPRIGVTKGQHKICDSITWSEPPFRALSNDVGVWGAYPSRNGRKTGVTASKLPEPTQTAPIGAMQMQQIMHQTRMHAHAAEIQSPAMRGQPAAIRTRMYMCGTL